MSHAIRVELKRGRSKPLWLGHPWVFSGAIHKVDGDVGDAGGPCLVLDERGNVIGSGYYNPHAQIAVRMLQHRRTTDLPFEARPALDVIRERVDAALARRAALGLPKGDTDVYRVANSEGDSLSGLIVDRLGEVAVVHTNSRLMYDLREPIAAHVAEKLPVRAVIVAIGETASRLEAIPVTTEVLHGSVDGPVEIRERGVRFRVDPAGGQKTGFYADQRESRVAFASHCEGQDVLDLFSYVGAFGLHAARAGAARVTSVDSSGPACEAARANGGLNDFPGTYEVVHGDVMTYLKEARGRGRTWSRIVCDPPKYARGRKGLQDAIKKYARLNTLAMASLAPDGLLLTCSCSQHVSDDAFLRMLTDAGHRLRKTVHVHAVWGQAPDHPFSVVAQEGRYLTGVLLSLSDA